METSINFSSESFENKTIIEIAGHAYNLLTDGVGCGGYADDLHNELFNRDYYIIGYYEAEKWIIKHFGSVFSAIAIIQEYEESNFGEVYTDLTSAEHVCNMLVYIAGEEIINAVMPEEFDNRLWEDEINEICHNLENLIDTLK